MKLDATDKTILRLFQENAKITNAQLAKEINLSPAPTLERVKKLEQMGFIKSYHAALDPEKIGFGVAVYLQASLHRSSKDVINSFEQKIQNIPEVVECHHITGSSDFLLKILAKDMASYNDFIIEKLLDLDEITNLQSMVVLKTLKNSKVLPINI